MTFRAGVLTVSDKGSRGERVDTSGAAIRTLLEAAQLEIVRYAIVADERDPIGETLRGWADDDQLDLVITTGGTGLSPRDVTPEATRAVLDYEIAGITEALRADGLSRTPFAMLSRAVAGVRARTLIVNLPGSERAVRENMAVLLPVLPHALTTLRGEQGDHV